MKYPREYFWFVERILRDYPNKLREVKDEREKIVAYCHGTSIPEVHGSGDGKSEPERIMEALEQNKHYQELLKQVGKIQKGLGVLNKEEKELVQLMFFEDIRKWELVHEMGHDDKKLWRMKMRLLRKIMPFVIGDWVQKK
jgi:hypothetical protein